jgi:hypothetical protein
MKYVLFLELEKFLKIKHSLQKMKQMIFIQKNSLYKEIESFGDYFQNQND